MNPLFRKMGGERVGSEEHDRRNDAKNILYERTRTAVVWQRMSTRMRTKITVISERLDKSNDEDKPHLGLREFFVTTRPTPLSSNLYICWCALCRTWSKLNFFAQSGSHLWKQVWHELLTKGTIRSPWVCRHRAVLKTTTKEKEKQRMNKMNEKNDETQTGT